MNVHGIYETSAFMLTFENSAEYQTYLQHQAGVSGSIFGFSAGVKKAWGGSMQTSTQQYMAALYVDVERWVSNKVVQYICVPISNRLFTTLTEKKEFQIVSNAEWRQVKTN